MMKGIMRDKHILLLFIITLVGFYLRVDGIDFGLPLIFNRDEPKIVENAIRIVETGDLNPHFFWHPSFMIYLAAGLYKILSLLDGLGLLRASTAMLYLLTRLSSAVFGTLTILVVYLMGKTLHNKDTAIIASLFLAVTPLHVEQSHYATIHIPVTFFITLCLFFSILIAKYGKRGYYVLAGVSAGLAATTSYIGGLIVVPLFIAFILDCKSLIKCKNTVTVRRYLVNLPLVLFLPVLVYLAFTPYTLLDYDAFWSGFYKQQFGSITYEGVKPVGGDAPPWFFYIGESLKYGLGYKLEILAIIGVLYAITKFRKEYIILLSWILFYCIGISSISLKQDRYMLPLIPILTLFASILFWEIIYRLHNIFKINFIRTYSNISAVFLLLLLLAYPWNNHETTLYRTFWVKNFIFNEKDTRTIAFEWIEKNIPAGSKIVRGDHTPDIELSKKNYDVLFKLGVNELDLMLKGHKWLIDNGFEYAVFSDAPRTYYGKMVFPDRRGGYLNWGRLFEEYFDELNRNAELTKMFEPGGLEYAYALIDLLPGENTFMFHSVEGCDVPSVVDSGNDARCLSFGFRNISLTIFNTTEMENSSSDSKDCPEPVTWDLLVNMGVPEGWYHLETGRWGTWRWMSQNATMSFYNPWNHMVQAKLGFEIKSFYKDRTLKLFTNSRSVDEYSISAEYRRPGPEIWVYKLPHKDDPFCAETRYN